ncbi:cytokinesis protein 3 [[Candida] railenensis]|uniref:Cytokinesis protein 3 n=1 Tax=[Candida] railenensis TaxID=45579 RepID=A0A9P0VZH8_9ASCO|nr:cytokinesis protein 3 [[Candida] railenensis]
MSIPNLPFKVKTTFSWAGEEEGDLGFIEGEIVEVYSVVDESWWSGKLRRNGAEGIFPRDYVTIMEDQFGMSTSSKTNTPTPTMPSTPTKSPMQYKSPNTSFTAANTSYSGYSGNGKSQKAPMSASKGGAYPRSPGQGHGQTMSDHYHQNELLQLQQRELELEKFRLLKQQQHYQVKKLQEQHKRMSYQQQNAHSSSSSSPPLPPSQLTKSQSASRIKQSQSQTFPAKSYKSNSNVDLSIQTKFKPPPLAHSNTIESYSPVHSPKIISPRDQMLFADIDDDEITNKRKQLERELKQLKLIEKSRKSQYGKPASGSRRSNGDISNESSFISEGVMSSKKNYRSRDDLSKKLSCDLNEQEVVEVYDVDGDYQDAHNVEEEDEDDAPPPPVRKSIPTHKSMSNINRSLNQPQKHHESPYDADDFRFSDEELLRLSQIQQEELKNSIKSLQSDVLNLSELSATSAGSFMRHKYENELIKQNGQIPEIAEKPEPIPKDNQDVLETIFQEKKSGKHSNIFQKLLKKKSESGENLIEQKLLSKQGIDDPSSIDWTTFKSDLNRMNSLTTQSKQARTKRIVRNERSLIIKPLEFVSDINTNEVLGEIDEEKWESSAYGGSSLRKIDSFVSKYDISTDLNEFIADVSVKLSGSRLSQVRAVLLQLIKFRIIEEEIEDGGKISQQKPKLQELMSKGEGSIYQMNYLFKKMLDALRIPSEIVLGFWKRPNEFYHNEQYVLNHCWLSILLDDQFFIMDMYNFAHGEICNVLEEKYNEFYFLARPLSVVSTHIPSIIDLQHVVPPIDQNIAFYLPRMYSGFYKNNLKFGNFNNALTRLTDLEFFELELEIPTDVEIFTLIKTSKVTTNELTLAQVYWTSNTRIAKIKAILPENESIGVLQIFSGPKGLQKHFDNIHELSIVIPLYHSGSYKPCKFVPRFPTVQSQNNDLYIKQPQTNKIIVKNAYNFEIVQHPSQGLNTGSGVMNLDFKLVIESPSGKYFKLNKLDQSKPFGTFESNIKCSELGFYRGLVIGDNGTSWYVFAQWECVPGLIKN